MLANFIISTNFASILNFLTQKNSNRSKLKLLKYNLLNYLISNNDTLILKISKPYTSYNDQH